MGLEAGKVKKFDGFGRQLKELQKIGFGKLEIPAELLHPSVSFLMEKIIR